DLYDYQLVHLTGTAKLIELPIEKKHIPNIFLGAALVSDGKFYTDTEQIIVPPVEQFLDVEVKADREQYQPREEGTLTITTRDQSGRAVPAEVALGLIDESVFYIQEDYAGDPRRFYYGNKRGQYVQTQSTFQQKSYAKLIEGAGKQLVDSRMASMREGRADYYRDGAGAKDEARAYAQYSTDDSTGFMAGAAGKAPMASITETVEVTALPANGRRIEALAKIAPAAGPVPTGQEPAVQVRSDFRSTVFWQPDVVTDADGKATVKVKYPDSLTGWQATARVATTESQFGIANTSTRTKQPLIVRLQSPRFFVAGDQVTVSAVINNNTEQAMRVAPSLNAEGLIVSGRVVDGKVVTGEPSPVEIKADGEARIDWLVSARQAGSALLKVTARGDSYSDAMENRFAVYEHGIEKFVSKSGKLRAGDALIRLELPKERRAESTTLTVQVAPSMAVTMLDALPYLIDYPYGCTEQTMSRFLPAAITAKTLRELGLRPETLMGRIFGGVAEEHAGATHPEGKKDLRRLDDMVRQGLDRLYNFQHEDGGWGWWKEGESDHFMTAYVVWGLALARGAGIEVKGDALERGVKYLDREIVEEEDNYDQQAWMLHALSVYQANSMSREVLKFQAKAFDNLWANRDRLNAYTRALLALSAQHFGDADRAKTLVRNLENGVKIDSTPDTSVIQRGAQQSQPNVIGTAHWGEDGIYWRWSDGGVEATAFALRALLAIDPQNKLIERVTNWLIKNRRGAQWSNTRDTAITVLTLNEYLRSSGELQPDLEYELLVNGNSIVRKKLTGEDALSAPSQFRINRADIKDGTNEILIRRRGGHSPIYFSAQAQFFSLEEPITAAGNEIFVRRQYYQLVGRPTLLKGYVYERRPIEDGETIMSGERIEAVITIEAKNNYEYLVFEDLKPGGLEAVQIRSGEELYTKELKSGAVERQFGRSAGRLAHGAGKQNDPSSLTKGIAHPNSGDAYTGRTRWVYQELRDRKVALFIDKLPEGVWEIRYELRAEAPGKFHALPLVGHAMYVPEIRCNGIEMKINVKDQE
ncbi:MAG TPA: alpha-2-macroglobulin family protein, partial [Pyrinomonadaceae bacterium]|nr:alpha-2-macroglobulin family protein [Pyrinomonadaceae bacterium]